MPSRVLGQSEAQIHQQVADYLKLQYRDVIFRTDFAAGIKMETWQAVKHKRLQSGKGYPDLFIAEPRAGYHGLYLELKKLGATLRLKDGSLSRDADILKQATVLQQLRDRGFKAEFAQGFDEAKDIIDAYLKISIREIRGQRLAQQEL